MRSHVRLLLRAGEGISRAVEDAVEGVIVPRGDGVVLVVVAPGAAERQAEERLAERVDRVLDGQVVVVLGVEPEAPRHGDEAGGRHEPGVRRPGLLARPGCRRRPARGRTGRTACRWLKAVDDVVAIPVGLADGIVGGLSGGVGVADDVEPVPSPALAVGRRGQQPVDDPGEGVGRVVGQERVDVLGRRRQSGQVERGAADQGPAVRRPDRVQPAWLPAPPGSSDRPGVRTQSRSGPRGPVAAGRLEGPERSILGRDRPAADGGSRGLGGPGCTVRRSTASASRPARLEPRVGGHLEVPLVPDRLDEQALAGPCPGRWPGRCRRPASSPPASRAAGSTPACAAHGT